VRRQLCRIGCSLFGLSGVLGVAIATQANPADLDPTWLNTSPTLQKWRQQVPDVAAEIANKPAFRTRIRLGAVQFESADPSLGWQIGLEDLQLGRSRLTLSGGYQATGPGTWKTWGGDVQYYLRPLGRRINLAPVVGYRQLKTPVYDQSGVNLGGRLAVSLSRGGGADLVLVQSWVAPGSSNAVGLTSVTLGYAVASHLRLSTSWQQQNAPSLKEQRWGLGLEWIP
jgi:hypothetical protein